MTDCIIFNAHMRNCIICNSVMKSDVADVFINPDFPYDAGIPAVIRYARN